MYSVIVSFGVFVSLSFPISIDKGILGAYATTIQFTDKMLANMDDGLVNEAFFLDLTL